MTDVRIPLPNGATLKLGDTQYTVRDVIGRGGSCLAYITENGSDSYVIKEFYPAELAGRITRSDRYLQVEPGSQPLYDRLKKRFTDSAKGSVAFYGGDSNHSLPPANAYEGGNAAYSAVLLTQGETLVKSSGLGIYEIAQVMISLCNAVEKLHSQSNLYLDIKPDNIFLFIKEQSETRRIALFDFDTVTPIANLTNALIPFSSGWSPYEQERAIRTSICGATDVYSIAATFYWLVCGKMIAGDLLTDIENSDFSFLGDCGCLTGFANARASTERILAATLRYSVGDRLQAVSELTKMFVNLKDLSQPNTGALADKQDETNAKIGRVLEILADKQSAVEVCEKEIAYETPHSREYYNLIISGDYDPNEDRTSIDVGVDRVIKVAEYTSDEVVKLFGVLNDATIEKIKQFPAIIAFESRLSDHPEQVAYYCRIADVKFYDTVNNNKLEKNVKVSFCKIFPLSQKRLHEIQSALAIPTLEFTRTHWAIKQVDLDEELAKVGLLKKDPESDVQTLSQTLQAAGFDSVFVEVPHSEEFGLIDERTCLKMFHLDLSNNLFSYGALQEFLVESIGQYVFSRAKIDQMNLEGKVQTIAYKALRQLRSATGGNIDLLADELGGILLYAFLEQILKAPKLFSRVELSNNGSPNIVSNSGIHLYALGNENNVPTYQMIFGKSRIEGNLEEAIDDAFVEIEVLYNNAPDGLQFVESTVFAQSFDKETTEKLKNIIIPSKTASVNLDKAFAIFLGYPFGLDGKQFATATFRAEMNQKMQDDIKAHIGYIAAKIKSAGMANCSFYIYTLPFNDAVADKRDIMTALLEGR
ncbi:hypothetical protein FACS1894208_06290 [Clostridia bacterium]|nr:hypothetical protein FACS1894208_06290 [Clostridia bacterium]